MWNQVELGELRNNSQLSREINVAIPVELSKQEQVKLVREFVKEQFVSEGMIADVAFHNLSSHNPHAHIMLTMRNIDKDGFSLKKNRDWNRRELLEKQRQAWADHANKALELAKVNDSIDHRTLEEQGINRIPQIHLGANVNAMMKRGIVTEKGDRWLEIEEANKQIERLERSLAKVSSEITAVEKLSTSTPQGQVSEIKASGVTSSIALNFDEEEVDHTRTEYQNTRLLIHQELGNDISDPRLDLEIYLRTNSQSEIIKQSVVYQKFYSDDPKIAEYYLKATSEAVAFGTASSAITYKSLCDRKTPDLDKWAKKIVNSQMSKFYAQENDQSQNIEQQQTRRRGLSL